MAKKVVLAGACRTAIGKMGGALSNTPAAELGAIVIKEALNRAGVKPEQVNYINAHGTSTSVGDLSELRAVKSIFGDAPKNCCMSSTKSMTGHLLGAAGAIEAVITAMAVKEQICTSST